MSKGSCSVQKRARLGIDANRDELLGDDTHDSEDQVCVTGTCSIGAVFSHTELVISLSAF